jgi:threonine/homoserine/homoserine lactone efflux protein
MLAYFAIGILLGAGSSVLPGPCGLAVINAGCRQGLERAVATAFGAALGDATYAALGIVGIGRVLARYPAVPSVMLAISGAALVAFGLFQLRPRRVRAVRDGALGGAVVGLGTLLANPGALVTWVVVVGAQLADGGVGEQWCAVAGIGTGSFLWFTGVAHLSVRGKHLLASPRVSNVIGCLLVMYGLVSIARVVR